MTQPVLRNATTELNPNSALEPTQLREVADGLCDVFADAYRIFINTQGLHWNVEGPMFYSIHKLTEDQYNELFDAIDVMAERVRALGMPAPQTFDEFSKRSVITEVSRESDLKTRIAAMVSDYERAVKRLNLVAELAETNGDRSTTDLLTARARVYEHNAWMLRATIAS